MDEKIEEAVLAIQAGDLKTAANLLMDVHIERRKADEQRRLEEKPLIEWEVSRNLDAYVVHTATVKARTREEAIEILLNKRDALFNLDEEGDVRTFDDVDYFVEGKADAGLSV